MPDRRLILFTRNPTPGSAKTRLIPVLGARGAAELSRRMAVHALRQTRGVQSHGIPLEVRHEGGDPEAMGAWLGRDLSFRPQGEGDLGERMLRALKDAFDEGCGRVVLVGADAPELDARRVRWAFDALDTRQLVLGPAEDGGYYLTGARSDIAAEGLRSLFDGIPWGTGHVLERTLRAADAAGILPILLDPLADVDRPQDLPVWETAALCSGTALLSIVVPVINEAERLPSLLDALTREEGVELIVVDGGSDDGSLEICRRCGARCLSSERSRAAQLARGLEESIGEAVLFLHADTLLPAGFANMVRAALCEPEVSGGAFSLAFESPGRAERLIARAANVRSTRAGIVFGDQAVFARASALRRIGGVPQVPILEDAETVRLLRGVGRFVILPEEAVSSSRRYLDQGVLRTIIANQATTWLYAAGVSPPRLARIHRVLAGKRKK